ncbi:MAG: phage major capsid protein [Desulfobulbus sp.]|nr:phage major capsid protein [Desulfobulbus sp.]
MDFRELQQQRFTRAATVERTAINEKARTVEIAFSSEDPYRRYFGLEILGHEAGEVDFGFMGSGRAPFLADHDHRQQVGVIEKAWIGPDRKGRAVVRFSRSTRAEEFFQDIVDGIRTNVSVGYEVTEARLIGTDDNGVDIYRMKWRPFEASSVSVPADTTVGVGRSDNHFQENNSMNKDQNTNPQTPAPVQMSQKNNELEAERARVRSILALGEQHGFENDAAGAVKNNMTLDEFRGHILKQMSGRSRHIENFTPEFNGHRGASFPAGGSLGMSPREIGRYSILRAAEAALTGDWNRAGFEAEVHRSLQRTMGNPVGSNGKSFFLPVEVMTYQRDLTTAGDGGSLVANQLMATNFIDVLRPHSRVIEAGARKLTGLIGDCDIPRKTGGLTTYWIGEGNNLTKSDLALDQVSLVFRTVGAAIDVTRKQRLQSSLDVENLIKADGLAALGTGVDRAAIQGTGLNDQPTGIVNITGINTIDFTTAGIPTWGEVVDMETACATDNALQGALAYMLHGTINGTLKKTEKSSNTARYILEDGKLNGYRALATNQVPSGTIVFGNWSDLLIGEWGPGIEINVDNASLSLSGGLRLVFLLSVDCAVRHPESFTVGA